MFKNYQRIPILFDAFCNVFKGVDLAGYKYLVALEGLIVSINKPLASIQPSRIEDERPMSDRSHRVIAG
jgi:hypothetical protein